MGHDTSTLLKRNLHDVFGENDPALRRRRCQMRVRPLCVVLAVTKTAMDVRGGLR